MHGNIHTSHMYNIHTVNTDTRLTAMVMRSLIIHGNICTYMSYMYNTHIYSEYCYKVNSNGNEVMNEVTMYKVDKRYLYNTKL